MHCFAGLQTAADSEHVLDRRRFSGAPLLLTVYLLHHPRNQVRQTGVHWTSISFAQQHELHAGALAGAEADQAAEGHRADRRQPVYVGERWVDL